MSDNAQPYTTYARRLKMQVTLTVDLDRYLWAEYSGVDMSEVRADVRQHILTIMQDSTILNEAKARITLA